MIRDCYRSYEVAVRLRRFYKRSRAGRETLQNETARTLLTKHVGGLILFRRRYRLELDVLLHYSNRFLNRHHDLLGGRGVALGANRLALSTLEPECRRCLFIRPYQRERRTQQNESKQQWNGCALCNWFAA